MNRTLSRLTRAASDLTRLADAELLAAFLDDRADAAFDSLVRRHGPMVFAVCRRVLRHQQDAEDAFQATFLVLARRAADVWPRDAVGSWLHGVAYRVSLKARAVRARHHVREQPLNGTDVAAAASPSLDLAEVLDRVIGKLPEVYRAAVVACDLEGLSRREAAERLGWKEGTLSGRLARARQLLAVRLRRMGLTLPLAGVAAILGTSELAGGMSANLIELTVRAALLSGGNLATEVSAPVAALTEGVVRGMFLTKLKTAMAAALAVGALGFGMWSATGAGDGPGGNPANKGASEPGPARPPDAKAPPAGPRIQEARVEVLRLRAEIEVLASQDKVDAKLLEQLRARLDALDKLLGGDQKPPADDLIKEAKLRRQVEIQEAQLQVRQAEVVLENARTVSAMAASHLEGSKRSLDAARARLAELQKDEKPAGKKPGTLTVHIRPLKAGEKCLWVELFESDCVLDLFSRVKDDLLLTPDGLSIWIVRDNKILPIDLAAIKHRGETGTNYQLLPGDKVFVQEKPGK